MLTDKHCELIASIFPSAGWADDAYYWNLRTSFGSLQFLYLTEYNSFRIKVRYLSGTTYSGMYQYDQYSFTKNLKTALIEASGFFYVDLDNLKALYDVQRLPLYDASSDIRPKIDQLVLSIGQIKEEMAGIVYKAFTRIKEM